MIDGSLFIVKCTIGMLVNDDCFTVTVQQDTPSDSSTDLSVNNVTVWSNNYCGITLFDKNNFHTKLFMIRN